MLRYFVNYERSENNFWLKNVIAEAMQLLTATTVVESVI